MKLKYLMLFAVAGGLIVSSQKRSYANTQEARSDRADEYESPFLCGSDHYLIAAGVKTIYILNCKNEVTRSQNGFVCGDDGDIVTSSGHVVRKAFLSNGNCRNYLYESAQNMICLEGSRDNLLYSNGNRVDVGGLGNCRNKVKVEKSRK